MISLPSIYKCVMTLNGTTDSMGYRDHHLIIVRSAYFRIDNLCPRTSLAQHTQICESWELEERKRAIVSLRWRQATRFSTCSGFTRSLPISSLGICHESRLPRRCPTKTRLGKTMWHRCPQGSYQYALSIA